MKIPNEERFLTDIKDHEINIEFENGVYRHIRFKRKDTIVMSFDLITYPGGLMIRGDMGTYSFERTEDMFKFFRMDKSDFNHSKDRKVQINVGYWGEKLTSECSRCGVKKFDQDDFEESISEWIKDYWEFESEEQKEEVIENVNDYVLTMTQDNAFVAMNLALEYKSDYGHEFTDFWETRIEVPTYNFIWCLYAISWGIQKWDDLQTDPM